MQRGPLYVGQGRKRPWRTWVLERQKCPFERGESPKISSELGNSHQSRELPERKVAGHFGTGPSGASYPVARRLGGHVPAGLSLSPSNTVCTVSVPVNYSVTGHSLPCMFPPTCKCPSALRLIRGYFSVSLEKRFLTSAAPTGLPSVRRSKSGISQLRSTDPWGVTKIVLERP